MNIFYVTGSINASKMCKSGGKKFNDWSRLKSSQQLIQALESYLDQKGVSNTNSNSNLALVDLPAGIPASRSLVCKVVQTDNTIDGGTIISGTYTHPLLIPSIAGWISPQFQIKANEVVNILYYMQSR